MVSSRYVPSSGIAGSYGSFIPSFFKRNLHTIILIYGYVNLLTHHFYCYELWVLLMYLFFFLNLTLFSDSYVCMCTDACLSMFQRVDMWIFLVWTTSAYSAVYGSFGGVAPMPVTVRTTFQIPKIPTMLLGWWLSVY